MKYLGIYLLGLFLSLPLPATAQSSTPMTDEYGATGRNPNMQEWYTRVRGKMYGETPAGSTNLDRFNAPNNSNSPVPEVAPMTAPVNTPRGGFIPKDRGAPESTGGGGTRFFQK
ncbi:MAG TPA: hypothetical protein V6D28_03825 [Leptolyngbyaceae cyanobacterium]